MSEEIFEFDVPEIDQIPDDSDDEFFQEFDGKIKKLIGSTTTECPVQDVVKELILEVADGPTLEVADGPTLEVADGSVDMPQLTICCNRLFCLSVVEGLGTCPVCQIEHQDKWFYPLDEMHQMLGSNLKINLEEEESESEDDTDDVTNYLMDQIQSVEISRQEDGIKILSINNSADEEFLAQHLLGLIDQNNFQQLLEGCGLGCLLHDQEFWCFEREQNNRSSGEKISVVV